MNRHDEKDPLTEAAETFFVGLGHLITAMWRWRLELTLTAIAATVYLLTVGSPLIVKVSAWLLLAALTWGAWPLIAPALQRARARRSWLKTTVSPRPRIRRVRTVPAGDLLEVRVPKGTTVEQLAARASVIRDDLAVIDVRVHRHVRGLAKVLIVRRDPFDGATPVPWPKQNADTLNVWDPMPFAIDEAGEEVTISTMGGHVLIAGVTGSGKSVGMHLFVASTALDPSAHLYLFDNKAVELAPWAPCARAFVQQDMRHAVDTLREIQAGMQARFAEFQVQGKRHVVPGDETHHIVIDEMAYYLNHPERARRNQFLALLLDILQRGRAAGYRVIAATQRPSAQIIATDARAQFSYRVLFRTVEPETTRMVLGNVEGCEAHRIPEQGYAGVGYLGGDRIPRRVRSYLLTDETIDAIAERATALRLDQDLKTLPPPPVRGDPAGAVDTRSVLAALPDDAASAVSYSALEASLGPRHGWAVALRSLRESGAVGSRRGSGRGGPMVFWRLEGEANLNSGHPPMGDSGSSS